MQFRADQQPGARPRRRRRGRPGRVTLVSGRPIGPKGRQSVPGGDYIRLELPGGGGFGDPASRDPEQVALDVADGLISRKTALAVYRVALTPDGALDQAAERRGRMNGPRETPM